MVPPRGRRRARAGHGYAPETAPGACRFRTQFLNSGSGYLGGSESNGSYVSLKSTNGTDYSTIIETTTATAPQTVNVTVSGGLSTGAVHVWATDVNTPGSGPQLAQQSSLTPVNGAYSLTVQPGYVYSLTTTSGQGKGAAASPGQGTLTLPYSDNFDSDPAGQQPRYLSQQQGRSRSSRARAAGPGSASSSRPRSSPSSGTGTPTPTRSAATSAGPTTRCRRTHC